MTTSPPPLARVLVRNTVWTGLFSYANVIVGFAANLILTRLLPVETFGFYSMGNFWTSQLNLKPKSGLHFAGIQHQGLDDELLGTFFVLDLALAIASFVLSSAVAGVLALLGYPAPVIVAVIVLMAAESLAALVGVLSMALEKELQVSRLMLNAMLVSLAGYTVAVGLAVYLATILSDPSASSALAASSLWCLLIVNLALGVFGSIGVYIICRRRLPGVFQDRWRFSRALAKELLRRGIPTGLSLTAVLGFVATYDNFLVGTFAGYDVLGFYDRAYRTAQWPNILLSTIVGRIGFLMFARVQDDPDRLLHAVRISLWVLLTFGIPAGLFLAFGAPNIIGLLYGARWLQSAVYLRYIAVFSLAGLLSTLAFWLAVASRHTRVSIWLTLSQAAVLVVIGTPLTWRLGVSGTLIGVGAAMAVAVAISIGYIFRRVPLSVRETLRPVGIATVVGAASLWVLVHLSAWSALSDLVRVLAVGLTTAITYLGALVVVQPTVFRERLTYLWGAWRRV